jgi:hypothetical protein
MLSAAEQHLREGRLDAAEQTAADILATHPDHPATLHLLGLVRWRRSDTPGAIASIERAVSLPGADASWHSNLTELYRLVGRLDEAVRHGKRGVELKPDNADAWYNLGIVHSDRNEIVEAIACERHAIELNPDHAGAHFELGEALLLDGDYRTGWDEYEWRFKIAGAPPLVPVELAARGWSGEPLHDKTLLVIADQGFGDVVQFMRYLPLVADRCGNLVVACGAEMTPLVAPILDDVSGRTSKTIRMFQLWKDAPQFDCYMALSSLPRLFGTTLDTIPTDTPYVRVDADRFAHWRSRLRALTPGGHRRIGLVWAGRPTHGNDRNRSLALKALEPLATLDDVTLVSLQKGDAGAQVSGYYGAVPLINVAPEVRDFQDTAAIIENLDLVVTVDTSVAHLAGALGRPAAILLPFAPDWRWLRHRSDSPWYPSVRLYRQTQPRDWNGVVTQLVQDLGKHPAILRQGYTAA